MVTAARVSSWLALDPEVILAATPEQWQRRLAAARVLENDQAEARKNPGG